MPNGPYSGMPCNDEKEYFIISRLHRDDIKQAYYDTDEYETMCKFADAMDDGDMAELASKLGTMQIFPLL